jgi:hypothetical protein
MTQTIHAIPSLCESGGGPPRSISQLCNAPYQQGRSIGIVSSNHPIVPLGAEIKLTELPGTGASFMKHLFTAELELR